MSARDKFRLGYGDYRYSGILSYENEVMQSVFKCNKSDSENTTLHKRLNETCEMHAVPPPMTGNYLHSGPDVENRVHTYTYGPEKTQPSEPESQINELDACDSNISTEPSELVFEPVVNESHIEVQPKVWSDAPIIEEYESDSDDECVTIQTGEAEYVAVASCCGQVLWIQNQMLDYGFNFMNTKIYIDNESTICIVKNLVYHSKTKHIAIRHHFIRDAYEKKLIQVLKIHTNDNVADLLTKAFDVSRFQFLVVSIGMINP
ncbi:hypothetical protein Tco_1145301 [Tanacetum coccineum]